MPHPKHTFLSTNVLLLSIGGHWIWDGNKRINNIYNTFVGGYVIVYAIFEIILLKDSISNLDQFMDNANYAISHLVNFPKVLLFYFNMKMIMELMIRLRENEKNILSCNKYGKMIVEREKRSNLMSILFFGGMSAMVVATSIMGVLRQFIFNADNYVVTVINPDNSTRYTYQQPLPFYSFIPWNYQASRFKYLCAAFLQIGGIASVVVSIVSFDTLFTSIINYISCQIKIIQGAFRTTRSRTYERLGLELKPVLRETDFVNKEMNKELNKVIKTLQVVFELCERMESIFTYVTLAQVLISLLVLCTCLYVVSSVPVGSDKFIIEATYMMAIEIQLFLYCYFGNKVTLRGENIPMSLYEGDWLSADTTFKKSMLITMTRMRRPIYLTVGKFTPLTLATFVTIGRGSYSFFAVIKSTQE